MWAQRDSMNVPTAWLRRVQQSIATCAPEFSSPRMVQDYVREVYTRGTD